MAWIEELPSGLWRVRYRDRSGHKHAWPELYRTKKGAANTADAIEVDQRRSAFIDPEGAQTLFETWAELVLKARVVKSNTAAKIKTLYECHVLPAWKGHAIGEIRRLQVQAWVKQLGEDPPVGKGLSRETVAGCYHILTSIMTAAVDDDLLPRSPCRNIVMSGRPAREAVALNPDQAASAIVAVTPQERTYALTLLGTGLRFGEAAGLRRHDVKLLYRIPGIKGAVPVVRVAQPLREVEGRLERATEPKTTAGERMVPLPKIIAALLATELPANGGPLDPVFTGSHGGLYRRTAWRQRVWVQALGRARDAKGELLWPRPWPLDHKGNETIPVRVHDLRHTWASWLEDAGIPRAATEELLGHSRRGVTERYIHTFPEVLVRAARAIDERLAMAARALHLAA